MYREQAGRTNIILSAVINRLASMEIDVVGEIALRPSSAVFYHGSGVDEIYVYVTGRCLTRKFYFVRVK